MAEVLLRRRLHDAGVDAHVSSAGLFEGGAVATRHGVAVMADRGLDLSAHRSRTMDAEMLAQADLVIAMAREHVREVALFDAELLNRTFTLKELARGADDIGPRGPDEPLVAWLARIAANRSRSALVGVGHDDALDVADPVGRGRADYETTANLLDDLLGRVVTLAFPPSARTQERSA